MIRLLIFFTSVCLLSSMGQVWEPVAMINSKLRNAGISPGGEGCQFPQHIMIDSIDGDFVLFGTDVGGMYRSLDGGRTFSPCNSGFSANGVAGFAIDPVNKDHCLAVGDNTGNEYYKYGGIYLSVDRGESWKQVLPKLNRGREKGREQIAFDPSSYDTERKICKIAYWVEESNKKEPGGRLYKTVDGGESWQLAANGKAYGGGKPVSIIKVHPAKGYLYIANNNGFWKSLDGGKSFILKAEGYFSSLDVVVSKPDYVWTTRKDMILVSKDAGETFTEIKLNGMQAIRRLKISPVNIDNMVANDPVQGNKRFYSRDGGKSWHKSKKDLRHSWVPGRILYDGRSNQVVWHPLNPDVAFGIGPGDLITKTEDGGRSYQWSANGYNAIMTGGLMNFSAENPDILYFGSQDYNGALTKDAGRNWQFLNLSISNTKNAVRSGGDDSDPWGFVYGAYSPDGKICYGGNIEYMGKDYDLWISFDGGKSSELKVKQLTGCQVSYSDPVNKNVLFCWGWYSTDRGVNWAKMSGCDGVFIASYGKVRTLFGRDSRKLVQSNDHGKSWQVVAEFPAEVRDVAYDHVKKRFWVAVANNHLYKCDAPGFKPVSVRAQLPRDQHNDQMMVSTVAIDPVKPEIVYVGACGTGLFFQRNNAVARSIDGGENWKRLTCNPEFAPARGVTGGQMASAIRVHPVNRYLYAGTCCFGIWRIGPPPEMNGK